MTLGITLAELQSILDEGNNVWKTEDIPQHLKRLKALHPNVPIDPDIPEPGAVFRACIYLKSRALPLSLVYRYFTSQHPVLTLPHTFTASATLDIDGGNSGVPLRTPATPSSNASDSSLEWNPSEEGPNFAHRSYASHRARGNDRRTSIGYEIRDATQDRLADKAFNATMSAEEFADGESLDYSSNAFFSLRI